MEVVKSFDLKSGFKISILLDEDTRLAVQLANSRNEYVGQLFASEETLKTTVSSMSNYEIELSSEDEESIKNRKTKVKTESLDGIRSFLYRKD